MWRGWWWTNGPFFPRRKYFFAPGRANDRWLEQKKIWRVEKEKQHVARYSGQRSLVHDGRNTSYSFRGESHQAAKGGLVFVATFLLTYLLLAMVRPRAVVYKRGEEEVPRFRPGAAMLWALAAGTVGIGLCLVDR